MTRKNHPREKLLCEKEEILQFMFDCTYPCKDNKVPVQDIFLLYQAWRSKRKLPPTILSVDGFGRLFPTTYVRKSTWWAPIKHALNCVFGIGIRP